MVVATDERLPVVHMDPRKRSEAANWISTLGDCGNCVPTGDEPEEGSGGMGGTSCAGVEGPDRFVTPGIYAIWMTFDARVRTVEAIEAMVCVDTYTNTISLAAPLPSTPRQ